MTSIRGTAAADLPDILSVVRGAFGTETEAELTRALLADPTARPCLSLLAIRHGRAVGHILFTRARIDGADLSAALLAPLSVVPGAQRQGVGGRLVEAGLRALAAADTGLVFVLGHPDYYPRHGFEPAGRRGLHAPYPIAPEHAEAWMVLALRDGLLGKCRGTVRCAETLDRAEVWRA